MEPRTSRRLLVLLAALAVALPLALSGGSALAVHDEDLFELDENAVDDPANEPDDDWDTLFNALPATGGDALAFTFVVDGVEGDDPATPAIETSDDDVFAQSSKDTNNISSWKWKDQFPEDKNDIENAYVAAYTNPDDELILYFGIDRMANNGDAALGMWFLQQEVSQLGDGVGNDPFQGVHEPGDILVQTDFTTGGTIERIDVFMWDADTFLAPDAPGDVFPGASLFGGDLWRIFSGQDCDSSGGGDLACGQVNTTAVSAPWDYRYKCVGSNQPAECAGLSGVQDINVFPKATFFEGGINLTDALQGQDVCLATMVAESRSSQSETATLDDKALGGFNLCGDITAHKYYDHDADGTDDGAGDEPLEGWTMFIDENANETLDWTDGDSDGLWDEGEGEEWYTTGADGNVLFDDLFPGTYSVCEVLQTDWLNSDPTGPTLCEPVTLGLGGSETRDFGNYQEGALRILKKSTKTDNPLVSNAGAVFSIAGPENVTVTDTTDGTLNDEDNDIGEICVSGLTAGTYSVDETSPPSGYGSPTSNDPQTGIEVVGGTSCGSGGNAVEVTFLDPPLSDIQVNFRDGGSGETSATIECKQGSSVLTPDSTTPPVDWDTSATHEDLTPGTYVCTVVIDP